MGSRGRELPRKNPWLSQSHTKNVMLILIISHLSFNYIVHKHWLQSRECIGHIKQHFMTSDTSCYIHHQWYSRFHEMLHYKLSAPQCLRQTGCCLADYNRYENSLLKGQWYNGSKFRRVPLMQFVLTSSRNIPW